MSIELPAPVSAALRRLDAAGHEAYIVGGCVRDSLLGRVPTDWDVTTSALPEETKAAFPGCPVLETGIRHGTVTLLLDGMPLEVTTYRVDGAYSDHRRPDRVAFTRSLREDLARRDFTVNALAYHPDRGLVDYFGGREDLERGLLRCVGEPARRFEEDALRILRGMRFSAVLGFSIGEETARRMEEKKPLLEFVARERVAAELKKLLCGPAAAQALRAFPQVAAQILPELRPMFGFGQHNPYHCYDIWEHTLHAVEAVPPQLVLRLGMLFHDVGKPACFTLDDQGTGHFYGHEERGGELARQALHRLRFDSQTIRRVCLLVREHSVVLRPDPRRIRRQLSRWGAETLRQLWEVKVADCKAKGDSVAYRLEGLEQTRLTLEQVLEEEQCFSLKDLQMNGNELIALGYRGREIGAMLKTLLERVVDGELENTREALARYAADQKLEE